MKSLQGVRKIFIVIQKLSIICYLIATLLYVSLFTDASMQYINADTGGFILPLSSSSSSLSSSSSSLGFGDVMFYKNILKFLFNFFYNEDHFMSLMHTLDVYILVCQPLVYTQFVTGKKLLVKIVLGTVACVALSGEPLVMMIVATFLPLQVNEQEFLDRFQLYSRIEYAAQIFTIIEFFLLRVTLSVAVLKMALLTRDGLIRSENLHQTSKNDNINRRRNTVHRRIFYYSLIPLFLNAANLVPDMIRVITPQTIIGPNNHVCEHSEQFFRDDVRLCPTIVIFTIGSFSYSICYLVIFKNLRKALVCESC